MGFPKAVIGRSCLLNLAMQTAIKANRIVDGTGAVPLENAVLFIAREDLLGDKGLVAYVVPNQDATTTTPAVGDLRSFLREKLPEYMVPTAFVVLEEMPLTPNGKVDRRALPAPDPSGFRAENAYTAPRTPVEERLVEIWEEVLGLGRVGVRDDFFELGGTPCWQCRWSRGSIGTSASNCRCAPCSNTPSQPSWHWP
jgi:AMP-binding enzyme C-terminal domain